MKELILLMVIAIILLGSGCATHTFREYYEPNPETIQIIETETGEVIIKGALKSEETKSGFTIGTQGLGSYQILPVSLF
jgi:hypothetical protein